jgi:hypothetical protein
VQVRSLARFITATLALFLIFHVSAQAQTEAKWLRWARHVGEAERNKEASLRRLKALPDLEKTLLDALKTPNRSFALDVIGALKLTSLLPKLLPEVEKDPDGFLTLTLNSLMTADNLKSFVEVYVPLLKNKDIKPATLVAVLE